MATSTNIKSNGPQVNLNSTAIIVKLQRILYFFICLEHIKFSLDDVEMGTFTPPPEGLFAYGEFDESIENPWRFGSKMAPFDEEVIIKP